MIKILIASHDRMASGMKASAEFFTGPCDRLTAIDAYTDEQDFERQIRDHLAKQNDADQEKGAYSKDRIPPAVGFGLVLFHFQGLDLGFFEFGQEVRGGLVGISRGILVGEDETAGDLAWG